MGIHGCFQWHLRLVSNSNPGSQTFYTDTRQEQEAVEKGGSELEMMLFTDEASPHHSPVFLLRHTGILAFGPFY